MVSGHLRGSLGLCVGQGGRPTGPRDPSLRPWEDGTDIALQLEVLGLCGETVRRAQIGLDEGAGPSTTSEGGGGLDDLGQGGVETASRDASDSDDNGPLFNLRVPSRDDQQPSCTDSSTDITTDDNDSNDEETPSRPSRVGRGRGKGRGKGRGRGNRGRGRGGRGRGKRVVPEDVGALELVDASKHSAEEAVSEEEDS